MFIPVALSLGFLGSFHCIGMCGPIAMALPLNRSSKIKMVAGGAVYNLGRVFTYALIGLVFGLIGQGLFIAGYQNFLTLTLGIIILLSVFLSLKWFSGVKRFFMRYSFINNVKSGIIRLFSKSSFTGLFLIGLLNGFLPCGLVYLGITGSIATGSALNGALFMAFFGLGTLPAMLFVNIVSGSISMQFRNQVRKLVPVVVGCMGALLILRGLNLGIPMISPKITEKKIEIKKADGSTQTSEMCVHDCCKKK